MASFLVIDDSMVMRTILRYMLERCGATVLGESTVGDDAVAMTHKLNPDAISIGVSLRGESGIGVLKAIRQSNWNGKVFFVANDEQAQEEKSARETGVDSVLRKPFALDQVSSEINRVMIK